MACNSNIKLIVSCEKKRRQSCLNIFNTQFIPHVQAVSYYLLMNAFIAQIYHKNRMLFVVIKIHLLYKLNLSIGEKKNKQTKKSTALYRKLK